MAELERNKMEIKCMVSLDTRDRLEELVKYGRVSTISDAAEIVLEELIPKRRETRCEIMAVADAFRAKTRRAIGKRLRIPGC